jgi:benzil reductase ((S)-benzoin forming)
MEVNVRGVALGSRAYVRQLKRSALPGVLINISSGAAKSAYAGWSAYGASKAAVDMLSECVAMEERDAGIRVHAVAPGVIDTEMQTHIRAAAPEDFPKVDKFIELKKRGDFNSPAYVARELLEIAFVRQPAEVVLRIPPEVRES